MSVPKGGAADWTVKGAGEVGGEERASDEGKLGGLKPPGGAKE
jgi:hypothetical protein